MDNEHARQVHTDRPNRFRGVGRRIAKPGPKIVGWWHVVPEWLCATCERYFTYDAVMHERDDGECECTDCYSGRVDYAHDYYQFDDR